MTADLMIPIFVMVFMFLIINYIRESWTLIMIALLFTGVAILFSSMVDADAWTTMFGGTFIGLDIGYLGYILPNIMYVIPVMSLLRILHVINEDKFNAELEKQKGMNIK